MSVPNGEIPVLVLQGGGALGATRPARSTRRWTRPDYEPGLGGRYLDRRDQRGDHRRQPARRGGAPARFWEGHCAAGVVAGCLATPPARGACYCARSPLRGACCPGRTRLLRAAPAPRLVRRHGARAHELLRHAPLHETLDRVGRFRPHQRARAAPERRRGQCRDRQLRLFRQHRDT